MLRNWLQGVLDRLGERVLVRLSDRMWDRMWGHYEIVMAAVHVQMEKQYEAHLELMALSGADTVARTKDLAESSIVSIDESTRRLAEAHEAQAEYLEDIHLGIQQILQALHAPGPARN